MKNKTYITIILTALLCCAVVSCEKDPDFTAGNYRYEHQELTFMNGLFIQWSSDNLSKEIKEAVTEIVSSMIFVKGGSYFMGTDYPVFQDEAPAHKVTLSDFNIGRTTITQKQWAAIMGEPLNWNEVYGRGDAHPATLISYNDALLFIERLNSYSGLHFRLPTEAEWEFAAMGGKKSKGNEYSGSQNVNDVAWCRGNADGTTHPVALLQANELGLYDMSGNVWEWCSDYYGSYTAQESTNPTGPATGLKRVVRGGSFSYEAPYARCKTRNALKSNNVSFSTGLRLAHSAVNPS